MENFLVLKYGELKGKEIFKKVEKRTKKIISNTHNKSPNQIETLEKTIVPRIALYQILQEEGFDTEDAYKVIKSYMVDIVCAEMTEKFSKLNKMPFLYKILKSNTKKKLLNSDNWEASLVKEEKNSFQIDVHKCLWHDATIENKCPELCKVFCECDDINFNAFTKIDFKRESSLGMGADKCDFKFSKASKIKN